MMARLGGDEFAILMPDIAGPRRRRAARRRDPRGACGPTRGCAGDRAIATSIGIAICPDDATDRQSLLTHADTALYRAKSEGRSTYRFFEAKMGVEVRDRRHAGARSAPRDLRAASCSSSISRRQNIQSGEVIGFEALLRWKHPDARRDLAGRLHPDRRGERPILQIGDWVLRTACREAATWPQPLTIAVNVSAVQLYNAELRAGIARDPARDRPAAAAAGDRDHRDGAGPRFQPRARDAAAAQGARHPHRHGRFRHRLFVAVQPARLSVRPDQDRRLLHQVGQFQRQAATIVRAVLGLGEGLGLPVLAEGVETDAELRFLQDERCDEVQGYLLGVRPRSVASGTSPMPMS